MCVCARFISMSVLARFRFSALKTLQGLYKPIKQVRRTDWPSTAELFFLPILFPEGTSEEYVMQYGRRASRCTAYYSRPCVHSFYYSRRISRNAPAVPPSSGSRLVPHPPPPPAFFSLLQQPLFLEILNPGLEYATKTRQLPRGHSIRAAFRRPFFIRSDFLGSLILQRSYLIHIHAYRDIVTLAKWDFKP